MKQVFLSIITICLGGMLIYSCSKDETPKTQHCESEFVLENDSCICPIGKYLIFDGGHCVSLRDNEWVSRINQHYFWAHLLLVQFPSTSNDDSYPIQTNLRSDAPYGNLPLLYFQYPLSENVDSFEFSFVAAGNPGYSASPEGYFWIAGKRTSDGTQILGAELQTRNESGELTSRTPLYFFR